MKIRQLTGPKGNDSQKAMLDTDNMPEGCHTMIMTNKAKDIVVFDTHALDGRRIHVELSSEDITKILETIETQ